MLPAFNRLKTCRYGQMLYNIHDQYIGKSLDAYGEFSQGEVEIFQQLVQPKMVVVEVGANLGAHTLFLAERVGPLGQVWAFEPQRILFQTLCANLALNSVTNTHCFQQAVGAAPGMIYVPMIDYTQSNNFGGLELGAFTQGEPTPVVTLDSLQLLRCHMIKIDVEGMEQQVLEGARQTISRHKPVVYLENDRPDKSDALIRMLDAQGYNLFWHKPPLFNPNNFLGNQENCFGRIVSKNMIGVHRERTGDVNGFERVAVP